MKILKHPVHGILVHFPVALLPVSFLFSIMACVKGDNAFISSAFYTLLAGVAAGWLAAFMGLLDYFTIEKEKEAAKKIAILHGLINAVGLIGFSIVLCLQWKIFGLNEKDTLALLITKGILVTLLTLGGYLGGKLVYEEHIGIE